VTDDILKSTCLIFLTLTSIGVLVGFVLYGYKYKKLIMIFFSDGKIFVFKKND